MTRTIPVAALAAVLSLVPLTLPVLADDNASPDADLAGPYRGLEYRLIGPATSGRVSRVTGVPGDPLTFWAATASGGVWKSTNGGSVWKPVFDDQGVSSVGSIAVAPSDPNVVWVGTGEANIRGNVGEGNGIYRSTDNGKTWEHVWEAEGQIGTIIVHPDDPGTVFAAVLGSPFGPTPERGVLRTRDGGKTWEKVLYVDEDTGASDVTFHPTNPRILFAGTWQTRRTPWGMTSGGPGSALWTSRDGGDTWTRLEGKGLESPGQGFPERGLPDDIWGKVGVRFAPSDPQRVYALIEAEKGGLFRSDDGGESWTRISASRGVQQRAWYYTTLTVDPANADVVWFPQVSLLKTIDGGRTIRAVEGGGWDYHDVWIDPVDPRRIVVGSDAGVSLSKDGGETWNRPPMPTAQFYRITVDDRRPYHVMGSVQDLGTVSGPSNSLFGGQILLSDWTPVGGGEAGHVVAEPSNPDTVWAGEYLGFISRFDRRTRQAPHMGAYPENGSGHGAVDLRYRFQWTAPIVVSPHDPKTVYHAANVLFRTRDGGQSWEAISPDLTRDDPSKQQWAGGPITGDNTGVEFYCTIFAVAESPLEAGVLWAGSDDGLVHVTRDNGENWTNVTPPDLPEWTTVHTVEASRFDAATAYLAADGHRLDDETPYVWKTSNYGKTWRRLGKDLDPEVYVHVVREDTKVQGLLYLGTERGVLVSHDDGETWTSLRLNMPTVAIADLKVTENDLVVGTLGRSAWILDDLTPIREKPSENVRFFEPLPAARWFTGSSWGGPYGSTAGAARNPPYGAVVTYVLPEEPEGPIALKVQDADGNLVRKLTSVAEPLVSGPDHPDYSPGEEPKAALSTKKGYNRATWDLAYADSRWVLGSSIDTYGPAPGPRVVPGEYTLTLIVDGETSTQTLTVEPDPRVDVPIADVEAQVAFQLDVRDRMTRIVEHVETICAVRGQLAVQVERLGEREDASAWVAAAEKLSAALFAVEEELHNPHAEVSYDVLAGRHGGAKLFPRFGWLANGAWSHSGPPTQGMRDALADVVADLEAQENELERLLGEELEALNRRAAEMGVPLIGR